MNEIKKLVEVLRRPGRPAQLPRELIERIGFRSPATTVAILERLGPALAESTEGEIERLLRGLVTSPDSDLALSGIERFLGANASHSLSEICRASGLLLLMRILGASPYLTDILTREPGLLNDIGASSFLAPEARIESIQRSLREHPDRRSDRDASLSALRRRHQRELVLIAARDLSGRVPLESTLLEISSLADETIEWALESVARGGETAAGAEGGNAAEEFSVLAMGKLGGNELNYFSDIDLIYVHADTDDAREIARLRRIAQELTRELSRVTAEGTLYRVDLRLRPDGDAGPIAGSVSNLVAYYDRRAHVWELISFLRARPCAGNRALSGRVLERVRGILVSQMKLRSPIKEVARLLERIRNQLSADDRRRNLKLMRGGIREVEFLVQALQLLHGGKDPTILQAGTLAAISALCKRQAVPEREAAVLESAYRFLRTVEHRIQLERALQSHSLPKEDEAMERLGRRVAAGAIAIPRDASFANLLAAELTRVRKLSSMVFEEESAGDLDVLFLHDARDPQVDSTLARYGFDDTASAHRILFTLAHGSFPNLEGRDTAEAFERILPALLEAVSASGHPQRTLENFARIISAMRAPHSTYTLFESSPDFLRMLVDLSGFSTFHAQALSRDVAFLDGLVESLASFDTEDLSSPANLPAPPRFETGTEVDLEGSLDRLLKWRYRRETTGLLALRGPVLRERDLRAHFSRVATAGLLHLLDRLAFDRQLPPMLLGGLGSVANETLHSLSDLDLIVVVGESNPESIEAATRFVQEITRLAARGLDYSLDFRLRGEGESAPLAQSVDYYQAYFPARGRLWERLAFTKYRSLWGDRELMARFEGSVDRFLFRGPFGRDEIEELRKYRRNLEKLARSDRFDFKWSPGGSYDLDYLLSAGLLFRQITRDRTRPGASSGFGILVDHDLLEAPEADFLEHAARVYRRVEMVGSLHGLRSPSTERGKRELTRLLEGFRVCRRDIAGDSDRPGLVAAPETPVDGAPETPVDGAPETMAELDRLRKKVRELYDRFFDRLVHMT